MADQHEAATAEIAGVGLHDRQRKAHGDGGVNGVAALLHDGNARLGCQGMVAGDHGLTRDDGRKNLAAHVVARGDDGRR